MTGTPRNRTAARVAVCAATAVIALTGLTACSSDGKSGTASGSASSRAATSSPLSTDSSANAPSASSSSGASMQTVTITIKDYKFAVPFPVQPGDMVMIKNEDSEAHTVTADEKSAGFDVKIDPGKTAMFTAPSSAGSYKFHCTYHTNMHGLLKVG